MPVKYFLFLLLLTPMLTYGEGPEKMVISYTEHPSIIRYVLPLLEKVYVQAGLEANFIPIPANRIIQQIESGQSDGDAIQAQEVIEHYDRLIKVGPPLMTVRYVLLCRQDVRCEQSVLFDKKATLLATDQAARVIQSKFPEATDTTFYQINYLGKLPELLKNHRFDYAIYVMSAELPLPQNLMHLTILPLFDSKAYHVLNKTHAAMAKTVGMAIERQLAL